MSHLTADPFASACRAGVADALAATQRAFAGYEELLTLNMAASKSAVLETGGDVLAVFYATRPADALAAQASMVKPLMAKSIAYGRALYALSRTMSADLQAMAEARMTGARQTLAAAFETVARRAPPAAQTLVAAIGSVAGAGQKVFEGANTGVKIAVDYADRQAVATAERALKAVKTPSRKR